jgi:hypothetical protein
MQLVRSLEEASTVASADIFASPPVAQSSLQAENGAFTATTDDEGGASDWEMLPAALAAAMAWQQPGRSAMRHVTAALALLRPRLAYLGVEDLIHLINAAVALDSAGGLHHVCTTDNATHTPAMYDDSQGSDAVHAQDEMHGLVLELRDMVMRLEPWTQPTMISTLVRAAHGLAALSVGVPTSWLAVRLRDIVEGPSSTASSAAAASLTLDELVMLGKAVSADMASHTGYVQVSCVKPPRLKPPLHLAM